MNIVMALGFIVIIVCARYVFHNLFIVKQRFKNTFYQNNPKDQTLEIDYVGWTNSKLYIFSGVNKLSYISI